MSLEILVAILALVVSVISLASQFLSGRTASLSAYLAKTHDHKGRADLLVIVNHGPAAAHGIRLKMTTRSGESWEPIEERNDPFPIEELAPGSSFYIPIDTYYAEGPYMNVRMTWKDKRWNRQLWTSAISTMGHPLGGGQSPASLHKENQARKMSMLRSLGL